MPEHQQTQAPTGSRSGGRARSNAITRNDPNALSNRNTSQTDGLLRPRVAFDQGKAKSGTREGIQNARQLMDSDAAQRAQKVVEILAKFDASAHTVQRLSLWLMGPPIPDPIYRNASGGKRLVQQIKEKFGEGDHVAHTGAHRTQYLLDIVANGQPSTYSKLLLALGKVSHVGSDPREVLRLVEDAKPDDVVAIRGLLPAIDKCGLTHEQMLRLIVALQLAAAQRLEDGANDRNRERRHAGVVKAKVKHLAYIIKSLKGTLGYDRKRVFRDVTDWARREDDEVRRAALADDSPFMEEMNKSAWKEGDRNYVLALVREHQALPPHLVDKEGEEGEEYKEDKSTWKVHETRAYIGRKIDKNYRTKDHKYGELKRRIEEMTDGERQGFLLTYLSPEEQKFFSDPDVDPSVLEPLHKLALSRLRAELSKMQMEGKDKLLARFSATAVKGQLDKTSVYQQLLAFTKGVPPTNKKIMHTLGRANGTDYYNIRTDAKLLAFLEGKLDDTEKQKMRVLLGIKQDEKVELAATGETRDQKVQEAEESAELNPGHWKIRLGQALTDNSPTTAFTVVTGAYYAAKRHAAKGGPGSIGVTTFMNLLIHEMSGAKLKKLREPRFKPAYDAIVRGTGVSVDDRLAGAEFTGGRSIRRLGGNDAKQKSVRAAFEDLSGKELLEEWSNIARFRTLREKQKKLETAKSKRRLRAVNQQIRDFILDVRGDRRRWLRDHFTQAEFVDVLEGARNKLHGAAENDTEFQQALARANYTNDAYAQERMKGLGAIDRQRQDDSGMQVGLHFRGGPFSTIHSHERREARNQLVGGFRTAQQDLRNVEDGTQDEQQEAREEVNETRVPDLKQKHEELERRTEKFRKARDRAFTAAKLAISIIIAIIVAGATAGFGAIPMSAATAVWVPMLLKLGTVATTGVIKQLVLKALQGDNFNGRKAVVDVAMSVLSSDLGALSHMASAHVLHDLGLQGASNFMSDNHDIPLTVGQYFEAGAIDTSMNILVAQSLPKALEIASQEDPGATSKWAQFLPMVTGWIGHFAIDTCKDMAIDASLQKEGLYSIKQENEWGGVDRDGSGHAIKLDRLGNTSTTSLSFGQKIEKSVITQAINLPAGKGGGMGLDKGLGAWDKAMVDAPETSDQRVKQAPERQPREMGSDQEREASVAFVKEWLKKTLSWGRAARNAAEACDKYAKKHKKKGKEAKALGEQIRSATAVFDGQWKGTYDLLMKSERQPDVVSAHDLQVSGEILQTQAREMHELAFLAIRYKNEL